jgi:hypothetical protein
MPIIVTVAGSIKRNFAVQADWVKKRDLISKNNHNKKDWSHDTSG